MEELRSGQSSCRVSRRGAFVSSLTLQGMQILKLASDGYVTHGGMSILVPYADIVKGASYVWDGQRYFLPRNAVYEKNYEDSIHGLVKSAPFSVVYNDEDSIHLKYSLSHSGYPSTLDVHVHYSLSREALNTMISVENTGRRSAPLLCGSHPYLLYEDFWIMYFNDQVRSVFADRIDSDTHSRNISFISKRTDGYYDDAFMGGGEIDLVTRDRLIQIRRRSMRFFEVYDGVYADGVSVAVEPMTGSPDAFNNGIGLIRLKAGETFICGFDIEAKRI
ncbi:MAG: aldose 1-epimerase [Thermoplasmata archaeon]